MPICGGLVLAIIRHSVKIPCHVLAPIPPEVPIGFRSYSYELWFFVHFLTYVCAFSLKMRGFGLDKPEQGR